MNIRRASKNDVDPIRQLVLALSAFYMVNPSAELPAWFSASLTPEEFLQRIESPDFKNYVYENETGIVAYIAIKNNSYIYHLFVAEAHQRKGVARKLWQHVLSQLEAENISLRSSINAIAFYKKLGFVETGSLAEKEGVLFQPMELKR